MSESVGREVERALRAWRLVTIVGASGAGKSAVAARAAAELGRRFTDGACVVDLSGLRDPELLPHTIAAALGVHDRTFHAVPLAIAEYLQERYVLIVLDSCEHLARPVAAVAEYLLMAARHVQILATSRRPLGTVSERVLRLPEPSEPARVAVEQAYTAAPPADRDAWVRLSIFPGGFPRSAAEAVTGTPALPAVAEPLAGGRFRLSKTAREYGAERLAADAGPILRSMHAEYYALFAARFDAAFFGPGQAVWLGRVRAERDNIRAALRQRFTEPAGHRDGARIAADLRHAWLAGGTLAEGRHWLGRALELGPTARLLWENGRIAVAQRDIPQATALLGAAKEASIGERDAYRYALALCSLGAAAFATDAVNEAVRLLEDGVGRLETFDTDACLARIDLAEALLEVGDIDRAEALAREVLTACEQRGEQWVRSSALLVAARAGLVRGDVEMLRSAATGALQCQRAVGAVPGTSVSFDLLAMVAAADGDLDRAAVLHGAAHRARAASGLLGVGPSPADGAAEELGGTIERVRGALGDRAYQSAFLRGQVLPLAAVAGYALGDPEAQTPAA